VRSVQDIPLIGIGMGLIVVVGLIAGVGGIVISDDRPPIGQAPPINDTTTAEVMTQSQSESVNQPPQTYAVTAQSATAIDTQQLAEYGEVGTQADARIELRMPPSDVATVQNLSWVTNVRPVIRSEPTQTGTQTDVPGSSNGVSLGVQQAHQNGITGEGVEVGIIDAGFDPANPAIASNVVETRSFREFGSEGDPAHGTSTAEVVTRVAPDSQLYLASVENPMDHEAAIEYLTGKDVDIIIPNLVFPAIEDDGNHRFTDELNAATDSGTLVVNAAGNYAPGHWQGDFRDTDEDGFHEWTASGDELNSLPDSNSDFSGGSVSVIVRWENNGDFSDYKPYLYNSATEEYIAEGRLFDVTGEKLSTETNRYASLSADVAQQPLSLVIENTQGAANDEIEVIVFEGGGSREIQRNIPASSISAPADVPAALAVAAYERGQNQLAPYSGRGPTDDGRTGIDVTGYTNIEVTNGLYGTDEFFFSGTSAAAPYVGGVAALVEEDQAGDQLPTELTSTLKSSSDDILDPGTDTASGSGVVNAADAVDVAEGTLTGEIRGQEDTLIADVGLEVSLERQTSTGGFEQIRTPRQVSDGQYTFEGLATGEGYRVVAEFQGESGSATVAELRPGTNTRDIVIEDITVGGITSSDVALSDSTPSLGSNVTVTVTATPENGNLGFNFEHLFNQSVATASAPTAQIGGISVDPIASSAGQNSATVTLGADDVTAGEQITIEYTITTAETAGQTVSLTGSVTNGDTQELPEISYTTTDTDTDPESTAAIVGDIVRVDGSEIENVEQLKIRILQDGVEITGDPTNSPVQADANGEYTAFVPVASGSGGSSYTVEVSSPRFVKFAREVTIQPQATERVDIRLQESSTSAIDTTRSLTSTEVTNGSTVTVTVEANFERSIDDAKVVDTVIGEGISAENLTITQSAGAVLPIVTSDPDPAVDITWNSQLGAPLDSDSVTVEYELTIPEDTPVGTTITFDGTVTNDETSETAGIDGDSSVEVVATTTPDTVSVGGEDVPVEFTTTENGETTVTARNAIDVIDAFRNDNADVRTVLSVIDAFRSEQQQL
jgi:hypothetical protein